jgi:hypothetical protein
MKTPTPRTDAECLIYYNWAIMNEECLINPKNPSKEIVGFGKHRSLTMIELAVAEESYFNWAIMQVVGFALRVANKEFVLEIITKRQVLESEYKEHLSYSLGGTRRRRISRGSSHNNDWDSNAGCGNTIF